MGKGITFEMYIKKISYKKSDSIGQTMFDYFRFTTLFFFSCTASPGRGISILSMSVPPLYAGSRLCGSFHSCAGNV